ncbi:MAG: hypothetical protein HOH70_04850 [Halieaceae bacterium]|jgi:RNA polymerase nonessential primary-like sigma factor|nr:hypothetical protein [Halieaceae bacterium]
MRRRFPDSLYEFSLDEVAAEIGVTKERTRQIQNAALKKLKRGLELKGYSLDDLLDEPCADDVRVLPPT